MTKKKEVAIVNPKKLVRDIVAGKTIEQATTVQEVTQQGVANMTQGNHVLGQFVGDNVIIQTITFALAGRVVAVQDGFVVLESTSWVADLGRLSETFKNLKFNEVEFLGITIPVNIASIVYVAPLPGIPDKTV